MRERRDGCPSELAPKVLKADIRDCDLGPPQRTAFLPLLRRPRGGDASSATKASAPVKGDTVESCGGEEAGGGQPDGYGEAIKEVISSRIGMAA